MSDYTIVRCVFEDSGRQCHYVCPGALQGDIVQSPGNSPARVVGFGRKGYTGHCRTAGIIQRRPRTDQRLRDALYPPNNPIVAYAEEIHRMNAQSTPVPALTTVEQLNEQLKAAKKAQKRAAKLAREKAKIAAERYRRRELALDALEHVAQTDEDGGHRIAAALSLLDRA